MYIHQLRSLILLLGCLYWVSFRQEVVQANSSKGSVPHDLRILAGVVSCTKSSWNEKEEETNTRWTKNDDLQLTYFERTSVRRGSFLSLLIAGFDCLFSSASSSAVTSSSAMTFSTSNAISAALFSFFFFFLPILKSCLISSSSSPSSAYQNQGN